MPAVTVAVTLLAASSRSSCSVFTLSLLRSSPPIRTIDVGAVPLIIEPVSATPSDTVNASFVEPLRLTTNSAAVPSVTGVGPASIVTTGFADGTESSARASPTKANRPPMATKTGMARAASRQGPNPLQDARSPAVSGAGLELDRSETGVALATRNRVALSIA